MNLQIHTSPDYYCKFLSEPLVLIDICIYVKKKFLSFVFWLITNKSLKASVQPRGCSKLCIDMLSCVGLEKGWFPGNARFPCALGPNETICHIKYYIWTKNIFWHPGEKKNFKKCYLSNVSMKSNYNFVKKSYHIGLQLY